ncbi:uncharacterized protein PgNI_02789 [Pyricularia grisea]|uniref:6-phosphofructo-2-kinase domain-containing protein n=1 Tax=Pyricularia grisea TaxID=148305 RepID=A0A6P8B9S0_PYRGI|nr:uncharacterized protein PgNI_02789 [Pyricularia grisea]TLD12564.1 hypothetical protein PgNI_02789 [Pyricularia grisea]
MPAISSRPEMADIVNINNSNPDCDLEVHEADEIEQSTAEIAANAPRYRRRSSTFIDAIHDVSETQENLAPAQLYSTMSGRLFHSGRIAIVMVGLPARGKTLGVKSRIFHLGDYRRATVGPGGSVPEDYFFPNASPKSVILRQKILKKCREDIYAWLNHENGQVAIYDAVNPTSSGRRSLAKEFAKHDVQTLFLESYVDDETILTENARNVKISSPDFAGMDPDEAARSYLRRIEMKIPVFEPMQEEELNYIRMINAGRKFFYNNVSFNYLSHRIVYYLTNLHIKSRTTFFVRAGMGLGEEDSSKNDSPLSEEGRSYAQKMTDALVKHREQEHAEKLAEQGDSSGDKPLKPLTIWTSTRLRTIQTAQFLEEKGYKVRQRSQMRQINPGVCEKMSPRALKMMYPDEVAKHEQDPYHHRYPRAESYHDLAVRLEPIILELEREQNDLLIIAHESVLRVLYAYLMHCSAMDIPTLKFPRDEIIEIIPAAYQNEAKRIHIPGLDPRIVPGTPDLVRMTDSGAGTPSAGLPVSPLPEPAMSDEQATHETQPFIVLGSAPTSPPVPTTSSRVASPGQRPTERVISPAADEVKDRVGDED